MSDPTITIAAKNGTANSRFYQMLPPEIRRRILIEAFGGRTLHIQRCGPDSEAPDAPPPCDQFHVLWKQCHRVKGTAPSLRHCVGYDWDADVWVFHPTRSSLKRDPSYLRGARGWLLSCRLGYIEAIEAIYATNTLHIRTRFVGAGPARNIPERMLPNVTSLEWVTCVFHRTASGDHENLPQVLRSLPLQFPNLRRLYFGMQWLAGNVDRGSHAMGRNRALRWYDEALVLCDQLVKDFKGRLEMEVGICSQKVEESFTEDLANGRARIEAPGWREGMFKVKKADRWAQPKPEVEAVLGPRPRLWRTVKTDDAEGRGDKELGYWLGIVEENPCYQNHGWVEMMHQIWEGESAE
ncbi:hypothetical protein B0T14DRAFT_572020 [Immersiella caudata]|uniref:DUF7730 domain-containing protein n=1 Tax=Immersiella caudata TaxID=314043 RepID=A0AA39TI33_9PEZI|nr:hypothetical protein B0T14DRAFT_572020 [Immersiella caudata]